MRAFKALRLLNFVSSGDFNYNSLVCASGDKSWGGEGGRGKLFRALYQEVAKQLCRATRINLNSLLVQLVSCAHGIVTSIFTPKTAVGTIEQLLVILNL